MLLGDPVLGNANTVTTNANPRTLAVGVNIPAGSTVFCFMGCSEPVRPTTASDSTGLTWTRDELVLSGGISNMALFRAYSPAGMASTDTISVSFNTGTSVNKRMVIFYCTGEAVFESESSNITDLSDPLTMTSGGVTGSDRLAIYCKFTDNAAAGTEDTTGSSPAFTIVNTTGSNTRAHTVAYANNIDSGSASIQDNHGAVLPTVAAYLAIYHALFVEPPNRIMACP